METDLILKVILSVLLPAFEIFGGGIAFVLGFTRSLKVLASPSEYSDSTLAHILPGAMVIIGLGLIYYGFQIF